MNYAKIIDGALKLFPKKIKVTFINAVTGDLVGKFKLPPELLPAKFNKPTTIEVNGQLWRVLQANPVDADDFLFTKKLTLHVQENEQVEATSVGSPVATSAWPLPERSTENLFDEFVLDLSPDQWRQIEFLPVSMQEVVQQEMKEIEPILHPGKGENPLLGFHNTYIRNVIGNQNNVIPFNEFYSLVNGREKGALRFCVSENQYMQHGFALHSDNYLYYGTVQNGQIRDLCISQFDAFDEELFVVLNHFRLLMADWCEGRIVSGDSTVDNEVPETDQLQL